MLIGAVRGGHVEIVRALLHKYADIDIRGQVCVCVHACVCVLGAGGVCLTATVCAGEQDSSVLGGGEGKCHHGERHPAM